MKRFMVEISLRGVVRLEIEADDEKQAWKKAVDYDRGDIDVRDHYDVDIYEID